MRRRWLCGAAFVFAVAVVAAQQGSTQEDFQNRLAKYRERIAMHELKPETAEAGSEPVYEDDGQDGGLPVNGQFAGGGGESKKQQEADTLVAELERTAPLAALVVQALRLSLYPMQAALRLAARIIMIPLSSAYRTARVIQRFTADALAPAWYVLDFFNTVFVQWPTDVFGAAARFLYPIYVIVGVAVIMGSAIGFSGAVALSFENGIYRYRTRERKAPASRPHRST